MRLPKQERRQQMLDLAMVLVRENGADDLTLGRLAERAGLSRPVAYEHFTTRTGLLIALYRRIEERQVRALREALTRAPTTIRDIANEMSRAYFACSSDLGREGPAISAALKGSEEMAAAQRQLVNEYVDIMCDALRQHTTIDEDELRLRCVGLLGAAEAITREMLDKRVGESFAVRTFASLIEAGVL